MPFVTFWNDDKRTDQSRPYIRSRKRDAAAKHTNQWRESIPANRYLSVEMGEDAVLVRHNNMMHAGNYTAEKKIIIIYNILNLFLVMLRWIYYKHALVNSRFKCRSLHNEEAYLIIAHLCHFTIGQTNQTIILYNVKSEYREILIGMDAINVSNSTASDWHVHWRFLPPTSFYLSRRIQDFRSCHPIPAQNPVRTAYSFWTGSKLATSQ